MSDDARTHDGGLCARWREIADVVGMGPMLALARAKGGTRLYIPAALDDTHELAVIMGLEPARKLTAFYGSGYIELPLDPDGSTHGRRRRVDRMIADGATAGQAALAAGMTERAVYYRKRKSRDLRQNDLFADDCADPASGDRVPHSPASLRLHRRPG